MRFRLLVALVLDGTCAVLIGIMIYQRKRHEMALNGHIWRVCRKYVLEKDLLKFVQYKLMMDSFYDWGCIVKNFFIEHQKFRNNSEVIRESDS